MTTADALNRGRGSFGRRAWGDAHAQLWAADRESPLALEDLERLAIAAYLIGQDTDCIDLWGRAHHECLHLGNAERAARCAFWAGMILMETGEMVRSAAWLARARRGLDERGLDDGPHDCVEQGYVLVPVALQTLMNGDAATAHAIFGQASAIGDRFRDPDLMTLGRLGRGQALLRSGQIADGVALLDEAMLAVSAGELSPIVAGIIYCATIEACQEIFDLRRAREWTAALAHWCAAQPDLVSFRGQCLVHRAEIMRLHGAWADAMDQARRACERLSGHAAVGAAFYQLAELHRLRGEFAKAEEAYRQASRWGREPEPGLAQLRLVQGQLDAAEATIRRAVDEAQDRVTRVNLLATTIEIMLAAGDVRAARAVLDELAEASTALDAPLLRAMASHAQGAILLAEGDARAALAVLRQAWLALQALEVPYDAARVRVLIGLCCRELGDEDTAEMELDAARWAFQHLGAVPDLARVEALSRKAAATSAATAAGGLTAREVEVVRLVAAGKTNRAIADELVISAKTVARHMSNIYIKLGLSSRAAATAYAYEHGLL
jgi:DNA-binding CsgD family transcriptional regulator